LADAPEPRKGMPSHKLDEAAFHERFLEPFKDPAFDPHRAALGQIAKAAFDGYVQERKSPITRKAGSGYADPDYDLAVDWLEAKAAVDAAHHAGQLVPCLFPCEADDGPAGLRRRRQS
jgi:hypothetical protein